MSKFLGGRQSGYSNFCWKKFRHLNTLRGGGQLKKPPCILTCAYNIHLQVSISLETTGCTNCFITMGLCSGLVSPKHINHNKCFQWQKCVKCTCKNTSVYMPKIPKFTDYGPPKCPFKICCQPILLLVPRPWSPWLSICTTGHRPFWKHKYTGKKCTWLWGESSQSSEPHVGVRRGEAWHQGCKYRMHL